MCFGLSFPCHEQANTLTEATCQKILTTPSNAMTPDSVMDLANTTWQ